MVALWPMVGKQKFQGREQDGKHEEYGFELTGLNMKASKVY